MEDGLFTFIFIAIFIAMSVLDAVGRRRKRQRQMEDLEETEAGADEGGAETGGSDAPWWVGGEAPSEEEGERETADQMVPEDFWAILTGQAPSDGPQQAPSQSRREPEAKREAATEAYRPPGDTDALGRHGDPAPPKELAAPEPEPAPTRRSDRWMEGVEGRTERELAFEPGRGGAWNPDDAMAEPWDDLEDISEGDLTGSQELEVTSIEEVRRRGRGRGAYTRLLETGKREDLRKAIVLREVLGPPVGFRD
ncbi:MAG: hypothetical protein WD960_11065 [Gemmatimonadota bacterium]